MIQPERLSGGWAHDHRTAHQDDIVTDLDKFALDWRTRNGDLEAVHLGQSIRGCDFPYVGADPLEGLIYRGSTRRRYIFGDF